MTEAIIVLFQDTVAMVSGAMGRRRVQLHGYIDYTGCCPLLAYFDDNEVTQRENSITRCGPYDDICIR